MIKIYVEDIVKKFVNLVFVCAFMISAIGCSQDTSKNDKRKERRGSRTSIKTQVVQSLVK